MCVCRGGGGGALCSPNLIKPLPGERCELEGVGVGALCSPILVKPLPGEGCEIEELREGWGAV